MIRLPAETAPVVLALLYVAPTVVKAPVTPTRCHQYHTDVVRVKADLKATLPAATVAAAPAPQLLVRTHAQEVQVSGTPVGHARRMLVTEVATVLVGATCRVALAVAGASGLGTVIMVAAMATVTVVRTVLVGTTADPGTVPVEPLGRGKTRATTTPRRTRSRELMRHRRIRPQVLLPPKAGRRHNHSGTTRTWSHTSMTRYMGHSATYISSGLRAVADLHRGN